MFIHFTVQGSQDVYADPLLSDTCFPDSSCHRIIAYLPHPFPNMLSRSNFLAICVLALLSATCVSAAPTSLAIGLATKVTGDPYFGTGSGVEWTVNGVAAPALTLMAGTAYTFSAGDSYSIAHHFAITTSSVVGASTIGVVSGLDLSATTGAGSSFTWTPTSADVGVAHFYICEINGGTNHQYLGNSITIVAANTYMVSQKTKVSGDPYFGTGNAM
jgi:hypothetical protein